MASNGLVELWNPVTAAALLCRRLAFGVVSLVTVGNLLIEDGNVDFQIFEPVLMVVALFGALFLVNGLILAPLLDRVHKEPAYPASLRVSRGVAGVMGVVCILGA